MRKLRLKKLCIKELRIKKPNVKAVVQKIKSIKLSDIKAYRKKLHDKRVEKQEAFANSKIGKNLVKLSYYMNKYSLLLHAIWAVIINFTIEAINAGREYSNYRMNQCIAVSISGTSLFSELKTIIIFMMLAYIAAYVFTVSKKFPKA